MDYIFNRWVIAFEKLEGKDFQATRLLPCHCRLVFKLFFATATMLWALLQKLKFLAQEVCYKNK